MAALPCQKQAANQIKNWKKQRLFVGVSRREATCAPGRLGGGAHPHRAAHAYGPVGANPPPGSKKFRGLAAQTVYPLLCEKFSPMEFWAAHERP